MKKGVTIATLCVMVVVLLILVSLTSLAIIRNLTNSQKIEFAMELNMIKSAVDTFKEKNGYYPITSEVVNISDVSDAIKDKFYDEFYNNNIILNVIDINKLNISALKYGLGNTKDDKYLISNLSGKIYYLKGVKIGNETYYSSNNELDSLISGNSKLEKNSNDGIVFKEENDKNGYLVNVYIPKSYLISTVTFEGKTINISKVTDTYYTYKVIPEKNGTIIVNYRDDEKDKTAKYLIYNK